MLTPLGRAESVHISEPSTEVDTLYCGHLYRKNKRAGRKVSIKEECPQGGTLLYRYATILPVADTDDIFTPG